MSDARTRELMRTSQGAEAIVAALVRLGGAHELVVESAQVLLYDNSAMLQPVYSLLQQKCLAIETQARAAIEADWQQAVADGRACAQCHGTGDVVVWDTLDSLTGDFAEWGPCREIAEHPERHARGAPVEALWRGHGSRGSRRPSATDCAAYMTTIGRRNMHEPRAAYGSGTSPPAWLTDEEREQWALFHGLVIDLSGALNALDAAQEIVLGVTVEVANPRARVKDNMGEKVPCGTRAVVDKIDNEQKRARICLLDVTEQRTAWTGIENLRVVDSVRQVEAAQARAEEAKKRQQARENELLSVAPARGSTLTLSGGVRGRVFWVGIGRGGAPTVGVRVKGEAEPRWVPLADLQTAGSELAASNQPSTSPER